MTGFTNTSLRQLFLTTALCIPGVLFSAEAFAERDGGAAESSWKMPTHIQLAPIMVPLEGRRSAPATFYLKPKSKKFVVNICKFEPRIRDAVFSNLSRYPVPVKKRRMVLKNVPKQLLKLVNNAVGNKKIGKRQVNKIYVYPGASQFKTGADARFPGGFVDGCQNVLRSEKERKAAEEAKKKE